MTTPTKARLLIASAAALAALVFPAPATPSVASPHPSAFAGASVALAIPVASPTCSIGSSCGAHPDPAVVWRYSANISATWRIPTSAAMAIVRRAFDAAARHRISPILALGVIAQESSFLNEGNPFSTARYVDPLRPRGLMQVAGQWHPDVFPRSGNGAIQPLLGLRSIDAGIAVLSGYLQRFPGDVGAALQAYNGNLSDQTRRYAVGVLNKARAVTGVTFPI